MNQCWAESPDQPHDVSGKLETGLKTNVFAPPTTQEFAGPLAQVTTIGPDAWTRTQTPSDTRADAVCINVRAHLALHL
eukprot:647163-Lingulodinium_polyedra.AAC.1